MMSETDCWQASVVEQRVAWAVAIVTMILMVAASFRPGWFSAGMLIQSDRKGSEQPVVSEPSVVSEQAATKEPIQSPAKVEKPAPVIASRSDSPLRAVEKKQAVPVTRLSSGVAKGFYVQVGAFHDRDRAQGLADQLQRYGRKHVIVEKSPGLYAVWAGPEGSHAAAEALQKALAVTQHAKGFIIHQQ